jgi:hypothetical protein
MTPARWRARVKSALTGAAVILLLAASPSKAEPATEATACPLVHSSNIIGQKASDGSVFASLVVIGPTSVFDVDHDRTTWACKVYVGMVTPRGMMFYVSGMMRQAATGMRFDAYTDQ